MGTLYQLGEPIHRHLRYNVWFELVRELDGKDKVNIHPEVHTFTYKIVIEEDLWKRY